MMMMMMMVVVVVVVSRRNIIRVEAALVCIVAGATRNAKYSAGYSNMLL